MDCYNNPDYDGMCTNCWAEMKIILKNDKEEFDNKDGPKKSEDTEDGEEENYL